MQTQLTDCTCAAYNQMSHVVSHLMYEREHYRPNKLQRCISICTDILKIQLNSNT